MALKKKDAKKEGSEDDKLDDVAGKGSDAVESVKKGPEPVVPEEPLKDGESPEPKILEMTMPVKLPKFRVKRAWRGSIKGTITHFAEGRIINPRGYGGMPGIDGLKRLGVELEEVKD